MTLFDAARMAFALLATLSLIAAAAWVARRFNMLQPLRPAAERRLRLVESLSLDPRRRLVVVRLDGHDHLILLSALGDKAIAVHAAPPAPPPQDAPL